VLHNTSLLLGLVIACAVSRVCSAARENVEFVAEHLPEVAMDNRYASLPLWTRLDAASNARWKLSVNAGYSKSKAGDLSLAGPMLALGGSKRLSEAWSISAFAFLDNLKFSGGGDRRPLNVLFARGVPLSLPVDAEFSGLRGSARDTGVGIGARRAAHLRLWGEYEWAAGVLWQRFALRDYSMRYRVIAGAQAGTTGTLDYSATYTHVTPYFGLAWPRAHGRWTSTPHVQVAVPLPRRGVAGRITGAGFDVSGNGKGKRFGDTSVTIGWDLTYEPWHVSVDLGTVVSQMLLERPNHEGVQQNWMLYARFDF
jgi:hypothetical protein